VSQEPDLTGLLQAWNRGDDEALATLTLLVHQELRAIARRLLSGERQGFWQPTELIHESYLRLLDWRAVHWRNRAHFFSTVAAMMRRVLVDAARTRRAAKRGSGADHVSLDGIDPAAPDAGVDILALEHALLALAGTHPRAARVVELRFFGGCTVEETAEALDLSPRTVINDWNAARAWLYRELSNP
jgi:RNA polymerase sigma-70 factor (ECF subfamily)